MVYYPYITIGTLIPYISQPTRFLFHCSNGVPFYLRKPTSIAPETQGLEDEFPFGFRPAGRCHISFWEYMTFLQWWYPHFTPQVLIIFSRKTPGFVGETHHFRKPPNRHSCESFMVVHISEQAGTFGMSLLSNMQHLFWLEKSATEEIEKTNNDPQQEGMYGMIRAPVAAQLPLESSSLIVRR